MKNLSMQSWMAWLLLCCFMLSGVASAQQDTSVKEVLVEDFGYRLASGDVISIKVFAEPDLSFDSIRLSDQGSFAYPFLGEVQAENLSANELQQLLRSKLSRGYLINPKVSVSILEYRQFYIDGEVKRPGGYPYQPGLTVRRATALSGGLTERANDDRITIIREKDPNRQERDARLDTLVMPGDSIEIGQGFF